MGSWTKRLLREPLVHFLVIGALVFVVDDAARSAVDNPRVIVVDNAVHDDLVALFEKGHGRKPSGEETEKLIDRWIYDEVMYREALALGLDKGDEMFRSRLELKLRAVIIGNVVLEEPTDNDLREWFETHRDRYSAPRRFDLVQFPVDGDGAEHKAGLIASGIVDGEIPEGYRQQARMYPNRSRENIVTMFGEAFASQVVDGNNGGWRAVRSGSGWHVARIVKERQAVTPDFTSLKPQLAADWRKFHQNRLAVEAFKEIQNRYDIRREDGQ